MLYWQITSDHLVELFKFSLMMFVINKTHMMTNLMIAEFMAVSASLIAFWKMTSLSIELFVAMFTMVLLIAESVVGLSMLISIIRTQTNDYLKSSSVLKY
uniref:NADH-ubiquinone oxidoreductase chain 4L n=1 Tax=Tetraleurodes acaciae TaxID=267835 RepID=Q674P4_TETAA|nr:NADH dehydrogenase subunit 4L [Tetraleurodes acaciae]AAU14155.1 NADH dehydrogenase subunit 4L [Tetraleurodes acaciae]